MRTSPLKLTSLILLASTALQAHAESPPIKPGLWEMTTVSREVNGKTMPDMSAQMAENMNKLPPEMRARMEEQMKARGVQMTPGAGGQMAVRMCITKDMLDRNQWQKTEGNCKNTAMSHSGATWSWKFSCTQPPSDGEGSTTFTSSDAYNSDIHINTQHNGQAKTMHMKHQAKWLGSDCGGLQPIKPMEPPSKS